MKILIYTLLVLTISGCTKEVTMNISVPLQTQQSFNDIWNEVISDPLDTLPQNKTSFIKLVEKSKNSILEDAHRTLNSNANILEPFDKLVHPNGICFKGIWNIDTQNIYSGYFKKK